MAKIANTSEPISDALICAPNTIFNTKEIEYKVKQVLENNEKNNTKKILRKQIADILREQNETARKAIKLAFDNAPHRSQAVIKSYCYLTDKLVTTAFNFTCNYLHPNPNLTKFDRLCVIGVGGYGRAEMAPFSDVDLLFLTPSKVTPWSQSIIETMLYILWDLRLKIGHATRTIDDCIQLGFQDQTIETSLLESRYLIGDKSLGDQFDKKLWDTLFKGTSKAFIEAKLAERDARHLRQGGQRYMLEPNVKEGKGGLRDLQTLYWITKHIAKARTPEAMIKQGYFSKSELDRFEEAHQFLWTVRCHLHLYAKRPNEQLTFDAQIYIAQRLGYQDTEGMRGVEFFMQDYFIHATHVGHLTRIFLTALEAQHVKERPSIGRRFLNAMPWKRDAIDPVPSGYKLVHNRLAIADEAAFLADPINLMRLFNEALRGDILIHPDAMRLVVSHLHLIDDNVRSSPEAQQIFIDLLLAYGNPERGLRRMNELGVLGAFIPEFQRIIALMQFNIYHHYTVDEHTIQCISILSKIELGELTEDLPIVSKILADGVDRKVLYIALLLHDIGKGLPEEHALAGSKLAQDICPRLGLSEKETQTVVWLVLNHLIMSDVAQKRDLSDPRTVMNFAKEIRTTTRLDLLTTLTVCDIRGVSPTTWNNWKAQLLRQLYISTRAAIKNGINKIGVYNRVEEAKAELQASLKSWKKDEIDTEISRYYDPYWQGLDAKSHRTFAKLLQDFDDKKFASSIEPDEDRDATRACFVMEDHPGIFSRIVGALALVGANVVDARSYTSRDSYAMAIFWIQDGEDGPYQKSRLARLRMMIEKTLRGEINARDELLVRDKFKKRERDFIVPTEITFDNEGSEYYTIIEVDTRDRPGLLYSLTKTLSNANIYIASAVIATYGVQAVDVFYVKDMFGLKLHSKSKQKQIAAKLTEAIKKGTQGAMS